MKWLPLIQRLPISQQLGLGLGIILFLVILLGVVAGRQAESLWQETQGMYDHPLQVRRAVGEIQADILAMYLAMREASEAEDEATLMQMIQKADHYEADAHRQFSILYERYLGPRSDIEVAERTFVEWKAIRDEIIRLTRADQRAEAAQLGPGRRTSGADMQAPAGSQAAQDLLHRRALRLGRDRHADQPFHPRGIEPVGARLEPRRDSPSTASATSPAVASVRAASCARSASGASSARTSALLWLSVWPQYAEIGSRTTSRTSFASANASSSCGR